MTLIAVIFTIFAIVGLILITLILNYMFFNLKDTGKLPRVVLQDFVSKCQKSATSVLKTSPTSITFQKFDQQAVLICVAQQTMSKLEFYKYVETIILDQYITLLYKTVLPLPTREHGQSKDEFDLKKLELALQVANDFGFQWWEMFHFLKEYTGPALRSWIDTNKDELVKGKERIDTLISAYNYQNNELTKGMTQSESKSDKSKNKKDKKCVKVDQKNASWTQTLFLLPELFGYRQDSTNRHVLLCQFYIGIGKFCTTEHDADFYKKLASYKKVRNFILGKFQKYNDLEFFAKIKNQTIIELSKTCKLIVENSCSDITVQANFKATCDEFTVFTDSIDDDQFATNLKQMKVLVSDFETCVFKHLGLPPFAEPLFTFEVV